MSLVNRILTSALGLFLISTGIAKFTGGHVFQYIEHRSGIDVFYPLVNHATGVAEVLAGVLILVRPTRLVGAVIAASILAGAVAFHLSPWLGVAMPTGLTDGAAAPWDASDFTTSTTSATFVLALIALARAFAIIANEWRARRHAAAIDMRPDADDRTPVAA